MAATSIEPLSSRLIRLKQLIEGKGNFSHPNWHVIHSNGLLDSLFTLYEECNTIHMKKDPNVRIFVEKVEKLIQEIQGMRVNISDFEVKNVIGRGHFGEVRMVREKVTGDVYAMKVQRKEDTCARDNAAFCEEERNIMAKTNSPWLTKLQYAFQDNQNLYLVMEFHAGGDMLTLLQKYDCMPENIAKFYLAELILAIHALHTMGYAHRDIKPDNILIDRTGHVKLADFGSASKLNEDNLVTSKIPVGTPEYISPEVLASINDTRAKNRGGYGLQCDWWSLGILAYEMLFGESPFTDKKLSMVYNKIMNYKTSMKIPDGVSPAFEDLLSGLLTEASQRFDYEQLINHKVFSDVDWNNIQQTAPPYVPLVTSQDDTSNFDEFEPDVRPLVNDFPSKKEFSGKNLPFIGFTYNASTEWQNESFEIPTSSVDLQEENKKLHELVKKLEKQSNKRRSFIEPSIQMNPDFDKLLREKEEELSRAKLDLKLESKERIKFEDLVTAYRDDNAELKDRLKNVEQSLSERIQDVEELGMKLKNSEVNGSGDGLSEKLRQYEPHNDINQIWTKSQNRCDELMKQNENLLEEKIKYENENETLSNKIKKINEQLSAKIYDCSEKDKKIVSLKKICYDLDEQLKKFESFGEKNENDLSHIVRKNKRLTEEKKKMEITLQEISSSLCEEQEIRRQLETDLNNMVQELKNNENTHKMEISVLHDEMNENKNLIFTLQAMVSETENVVNNFDESNNVMAKKQEHLQRELISIKEESAEQITQISCLKVSNLKLTRLLEEASIYEQELQEEIQRLQNELECLEAKYSSEKLKMQQTSAQQSKLIDFLQVKNENLEKKKKGLVVPRIFGKSEPTLVTTPYRQELEQERTKCRRLQDQLSQARAENMQVRNELIARSQRTPVLEKRNVSIPISPMTHAVHSALTASPTPSNEFVHPMFISQDSRRIYAKPQRMKHHIPHNFQDITCMKSYKCPACQNSILFGRPATKCQECRITCHRKCFASLPDTCGLPSGLVQHFKSVTQEANSGRDSAASNDIKLEGWLKVAKGNFQSWDRRYIRIDESILCIFLDDKDDDIVHAEDFWDFNNPDGEVSVADNVPSSELPNLAKSDIPFILKLCFSPTTTCWPSKSLYFMAGSFSDKQKWIETLESLADRFNVAKRKPGNKLHGKSVLRLKGDFNMEINCTFVMEDHMILIGASEGLFAMPFPNNTTGLMNRIEGIDSIHQISFAAEIGMLLFIAGKNKCLKMIKLDEINDSILNKTLLEFDTIKDIENTHLVAIQEKSFDGSLHLCVGIENDVLLLLWDHHTRTFGIKKVMKGKEPCCCVHFTLSSVIFGCDRFYEVDLKTCAIELFVDTTDVSLKNELLRSYPLSIFLVSAQSQEEEYLLCLHKLGIFVDQFGQKTRPDFMKWTELPLTCVYRDPYLFMMHFNSVEVFEIPPGNAAKSNYRAVMDITFPQYLGPAYNSDSIFVCSSCDDVTEMFLVKGRHRHFTEESESDSVAPNSVGDCDQDDLEFSFSNSLIQSIDTVTSGSSSVSSQD